jgi:serine/threonine protein phosphatase 1
VNWIIGDIHGMLTPLEALLEAIPRFDDDPRLYFVGDYVNRGPESKGVIERLLTLENAAFVRGNHDDVFDELLGGECYAEQKGALTCTDVFQWFMQHGLGNTLASYGADMAELIALNRYPDEKRLKGILALVPERHRQFIRSLPAVIEQEEFFVAHGKWDPDEFSEPSLVAQLKTTMARRKLLWGRYETDEIPRLKAWKRTGYFGHTPVDSYAALHKGSPFLPIVANKIVLLDTASALRPEGRLTAFCHDIRSFIQAERDGRIVGT